MCGSDSNNLTISKNKQLYTIHIKTIMHLIKQVSKHKETDEFRKVKRKLHLAQLISSTHPHLMMLISSTLSTYS